MKAAARVLMVFLGLLFIGGALFLLAFNYRLVPGLALQVPSWANETYLLAAGAIFLLMALILLAFGLRPTQKKERFVAKSNEFGEVQVSIATLENMVLRVVQRTQGIKDVSRKVTYAEDGLTVRIHIRVMPDEPLPGLTADLQAKTKEYLEELTGILVHEVKVVVDNIITDQASTG